MRCAVLTGSGSDPRKFLVLELLSQGSLAHRLGLRNDVTSSSSAQGPRPPKFSLLEALQTAQAIAQALAYLHHSFCPSMHVVHRDLKPDNIGFDRQGRVKLFDFGLCAVIRSGTTSSEAYKLTGNTGTLRYMAPEVVLNRAYNQSVDVYSFGILLWQLVSGKLPFREMSKKQYFDDVVMQNKRCKLTSAFSPALRDLLESCWHADYTQRPSFLIVAKSLEDMVSQEAEVDKQRRLRWYNRLHAFLLRCLLVYRHVFYFLAVGGLITAIVLCAAARDPILGSVLGGFAAWFFYLLLVSTLYYRHLEASNQTRRPWLPTGLDMGRIARMLFQPPTQQELSSSQQGSVLSTKERSSRMGLRKYRARSLDMSMERTHINHSLAAQEERGEEEEEDDIERGESKTVGLRRKNWNSSALELSDVTLTHEEKKGPAERLSSYNPLQSSGPPPPPPPSLGSLSPVNVIGRNSTMV